MSAIPGPVYVEVPRQGRAGYQKQLARYRHNQPGNEDSESSTSRD